MIKSTELFSHVKSTLIYSVSYTPLLWQGQGWLRLPYAGLGWAGFFALQQHRDLKQSVLNLHQLSLTNYSPSGKLLTAGTNFALIIIHKCQCCQLNNKVNKAKNIKYLKTKKIKNRESLENQESRLIVGCQFKSTK